MRRMSAALGMISTLGCSGMDAEGGDMNPPQESVSDGNLDLSAAIDLKLEAGVGTSGLSAGELADGWTVEYRRFLVTIGSLEFTRADGTSTRHDVGGVVDVLGVTDPIAVMTLAIAPGVSELSFTMPLATAEFSPISPTSQADREFMIDNRYAIYVEGTISRADGLTCDNRQPQVCTPAPVVSFRWGLDVGALLEDCPEIDVAADAVVERTMTIAGDRFFRTDFRPAVAAPPVRRAQWLADADRDRDGEVTLDELAKTEAARLFNPKLGYDVRTGAPVPVTTGRDFVTAQAQMLAREALGCATSLPL